MLVSARRRLIGRRNAKATTKATTEATTKASALERARNAKLRKLNLVLICLALLLVVYNAGIITDVSWSTLKIESSSSSTQPRRESLVRPKDCSNAQLDKIYSDFKTTLDSKNANNRFHTPIMRHTHCPVESWTKTFFENMRGDSFLGINVGCNKGLDAIEMARLLSQNSRFSVKDWNKLWPGKVAAICGIPQDTPIRDNTPQASGKVHCIEPMPSTVRDLENTLRESQYEDSVVVTHAAMSNYSGTARFPTNKSGSEANSLKDCEGDSGNNKHNCMEIPVYSLDDYLHSQGIASSNNPIDILLIDAEGFDYEVLQGASETLNRVRYLIFEVHIDGNWMKHSLVETIDNVLQDFTCYWAGKNRLWRITNCMNSSIKELYEYKSWSNVACVHQRETELANIMETTFLNQNPI